MALKPIWGTQVTPEDKQFYRELGQRIAGLRKTQELTQVQLAEKLGIAQQTMAHYEKGSLRIAVALLKSLALILNTTVDELLNESDSATKKKRGPTSKLQQQLEQVGLMPRGKQKFITEMLDALIKQQSA
ncbi:MAG: transcriptional regulator [Alteromonadaceae bacterium]|nr:MAG: transcriptional regulator [Alteromonadaceae bacterium]